MDTDGDSVPESWDTVNFVYSDPGKSQLTANRLIQNLSVGTTVILLIDVYRKSSVPVPADFDGFPDIVWIPSLGIMPKPQLADFDGNGTVDFGLDLNGGGIAQGIWFNGTFKPFGNFKILVQNQLGVPVVDATVTISLPGSVRSGKTDDLGIIHFPLGPMFGRKTDVKVMSENHASFTQTVQLIQWTENNLTITLTSEPEDSASHEPQFYPNPITSEESGTLLFHTYSAGTVQLDLYDFYFHLVRRLLDEYRNLGGQKITFLMQDQNGNPLEKGFYYGILRANGVKKVIQVIVK